MSLPLIKIEAGRYESPEDVTPPYRVERWRFSLDCYKGTNIRREGGYWAWVAMMGLTQRWKCPTRAAAIAQIEAAMKAQESQCG